MYEAECAHLSSKEDGVGTLISDLPFDLLGSFTATYRL